MTEITILSVSQSWKTSIWIITILPNPYMSHAYNKHLVLNLCICIEHAPLKKCIAPFDGEQYGNQMIIRSHCYWHPHRIDLSWSWKTSNRIIYGILLMHLSESCVRKNTIVFHKLQAALLVVTPHADTMPAKIMIGTRREVEVKQSQTIFLDHATSILFRSGIL